LFPYVGYRYIIQFHASSRVLEHRRSNELALTGGSHLVTDLAVHLLIKDPVLYLYKNEDDFKIENLNPYRCIMPPPSSFFNSSCESRHEAPTPQRSRESSRYLLVGNVDANDEPQPPFTTPSSTQRGVITLFSNKRKRRILLNLMGIMILAIAFCLAHHFFLIHMAYRKVNEKGSTQVFVRAINNAFSSLVALVLGAGLGSALIPAVSCTPSQISTLIGSHLVDYISDLVPYFSKDLHSLSYRPSSFYDYYFHSSPQSINIEQARYSLDLHPLYHLATTFNLYLRSHGPDGQRSSGICDGS
jgi:hypothetical protein